MEYLLFQTLIQTSKKIVWVSATVTEQAASTPKFGTADKHPEPKPIYLWIQAW